VIYQRFINYNRKLIEDLSNKLILDASEMSLKQCVGAISIKLMEQNPNITVEVAVKIAWDIVEKELLPYTLQKQKNILGKVNPNVARQMNYQQYKTKKEQGVITTGAAYGIGFIIFIFCIILGAAEAMSDGAISMLCMGSFLVLALLPKKK